jgi:FkbM family methyltransferase
MKYIVSLFTKVLWRINFFYDAIVIFGLKKGINFWICWRFDKNIFSFRQPNRKNIIYLRPRSSDFAVYKQIFIRGDYNFKLPNEPKVIVDLGANIGLFTLIMKSRFPKAKIFAVEPDQQNYEILVRNVAAESDLKTICAGVWNIDTRLSISDKFELGKWAMVVEEDSLKGEICAISMETIIRDNNIDFIDILKIDIETAEKILFSKNYENWLPQVGTIIIELHDWLEVGCASNFFKAISSIYDNYAFGLKGENIIISTQFVPSSEVV